jgi:hypothetical protein
MFAVFRLFPKRQALGVMLLCGHIYALEPPNDAPCSISNLHYAFNVLA